jgi:hypothetical protein
MSGLGEIFKNESQLIKKSFVDGESESPTMQYNTRLREKLPTQKNFDPSFHQDHTIQVRATGKMKESRKGRAASGFK